LFSFSTFIIGITPVFRKITILVSELIVFFQLIMKIGLLLFASLCGVVFRVSTSAQINQADWQIKTLTEKNTSEAELVIRLGDIDNINTGFEGGFNPFSGNFTEYNEFPWEVDETDPAGTDRIMVPTSYKYGSETWTDGYTETTERPGNLPVTMKLEFKPEEVKPLGAILQIFVNDIQSVSSKSRFKVALDGKESAELTKLVTQPDMTGPKGKLVSYKLTPAEVASLNSGKLEILIDDATSGVGDGYAVDFIRLLVNPKPGK